MLYDKNLKSEFHNSNRIKSILYNNDRYKFYYSLYIQYIDRINKKWNISLVLHIYIIHRKQIIPLEITIFDYYDYYKLL